jgi:TRAP-type mannitol/chloroaromatic compound transport system substrate-binding protein
MKRREFMRGAGVAAAAGVTATSTFPKPAIAQTAPEVRWRIASSYPKSLDTLFGGAEFFAKRVAEITDNKFQIQAFGGGEIVPGLQAADAVTNGTIEMCQTSPYYYWGKDPAWAQGSCLPFGLNTRGQNAWWYHGGGEKLMNDFYAKANIYALVAGNTGAQMGGFLRNEIKSVADLKGVKFRMGGFGGKVFSKVGVVPQSIAGGDIYPALEKGTIDGAEWVGPYDDEKLGFHKVAKFYYFPGWWEGTSMIQNFVNKAKWDSLPKPYQAAVHAASADAHVWMQAKYDAQNPAALGRMLAQGVQLRQFPQDVLDACFKASEDTYTEMSAQSAEFKKIWDSVKPFRKEQYLWMQLTEYTYDSYMIYLQRNNRL